MQESAIKGLESKGSDAEIRESRIRRISVEGYNTFLRWQDVDDALREHFASCGKIIHVYVPRNDEETILCRFAFIYFNGEDEEKALRLDGSDMGGHILKIKSYPFHENHLDDFLAPMKEVPGCRPQHDLKVTGYDTSLPVDDIEMVVEKYFNTNGSFVYQGLNASGVFKSTAIIHVDGQEGVDKALELSGRSVGGLVCEVSKVFPLPKKPVKCGYTHPHCFTLLTKEQIEDPSLYYIYESDQQSKTKTKTKKKTREGNQKKKSETTARNPKKKSKTREGNQKKKKKSERLGTEIRTKE